MKKKSDLPSALLDKPMPEFRLPKLHKLEEILTPADLQGEVLLLNIWSSWCSACKIEHPYLVHLAKKGIKIIGVNYKDERPDALQWLEKLEDPYLYSIEDQDGQLGLNLGVYGAPETFLIDKNNVIRYKHVGIIDQWIWEEALQPRYQDLQKEFAK